MKNNVSTILDQSKATMMSSSLLLTTFLIISAVQAADIGKPHSTVITLKDNNFDEHLNDPANGLWLLKFYAPW